MLLNYTGLPQIKKKLNVLCTFSKTPQIQNFTKNRPVGAEFHNNTYVILLAVL